MNWSRRRGGGAMRLNDATRQGSAYTRAKMSRALTKMSSGAALLTCLAALAADFPAFSGPCRQRPSSPVRPHYGQP